MSAASLAKSAAMVDQAIDARSGHEASVKRAPGVLQHAPDGVVLTRGDTIHPEPIAWLWPGWLAQGKLHVLAGAPGQGKTTIALALAAILTTGRRWPDGTRGIVGSVVIWSGEDDLRDTLVPRLRAMGADMTRVHFVESVRIRGEAQPFDPARDMLQLLAAVEWFGDVRLLIVDPVVSAVAGDSHKNTEVRRALQPLVDLGASISAAILGITHFSKGSAGRDPTERVVGSMAFGAVARVVMAAAKVNGQDGDEDRRILIRSKSNIGPDDGGFEYSLDQRELDDCPGVVASCVTFGASIEGSARELLAEAEAEPDAGEGDVGDFIRGLLADGSVSAKTIKADADGAGYSWDQVKRASLRIGVEKRKDGLRGGWVWSLPITQPNRRAHEGSEGSGQNLLRSSLPSALSSDDSRHEGAEDAAISNVAPSVSSDDAEVF